MSLLYYINRISADIRNAYENMKNKSNVANMQIERHIGDNLVIGVGTYSSDNHNNNNKCQLLKFNKNYYKFESLTHFQNKMIFEWKNVKNVHDAVLLEFEKSIPLNIIIYKLCKVDTVSFNHLVLCQGIFEPKYFKSIGICMTKDIDALMNI